MKVVFKILDAVPLHTDVRVVSVDLEPDLARWLHAVGLETGSTVRILRRAALGGPLHVKSSTGGEFALHRSLARAIQVTRDQDGLARASRASEARAVATREDREIDLTDLVSDAQRTA